jgi:hypothetical protein
MKKKAHKQKASRPVDVKMLERIHSIERTVAVIEERTRGLDRFKEHAIRNSAYVAVCISALGLILGAFLK